MTVKLEKVLAVWLVWKHFSKFPKIKCCQLASGQCFSVTRDAQTGFKSTYRSQGKIFPISIENELANWFKKLANFRRMYCYPGKNLSLKSVKMRT